MVIPGRHLQSVELTSEALDFLRGIFLLFDIDGVCTTNFFKRDWSVFFYFGFDVL